MRRRAFRYAWRTELSRGITWDRSSERWKAVAMIGGRKIVVGKFIELTTAVEEKLYAETPTVRCVESRQPG